MDREKAIQVLKRCEAESHCEHYKRHYCCIGCGQREALDLAIEALKDPKPVCEDAISRNWILRIFETWQKVSDYNEAEQNIISAAICEVKNAPPVEPKRPKGEWVSCSEPPEDRRYVFLAHGTNDFKSCCIGHYEQGMGWYEDRNFFAKPIYDCKYWCDIPDLPDMGDNQFDMRGDKNE